MLHLTLSCTAVGPSGGPLVEGGLSASPHPQSCAGSSWRREISFLPLERSAEMLMRAMVVHLTRWAFTQGALNMSAIQKFGHGSFFPE